MSKKDIKKKNISANATNDSGLENVSGGFDFSKAAEDLSNSNDFDLCVTWSDGSSGYGHHHPCEKIHEKPERPYYWDRSPY